MPATEATVQAKPSNGGRAPERIDEDATYYNPRVDIYETAESFVFRWKEDKPGTWLYHCHVEEHMMNGMIGLYVVTK